MGFWNFTEYFGKILRFSLRTTRVQYFILCKFKLVYTIVPIDQYKATVEIQGFIEEYLGKFIRNLLRVDKRSMREIFVTKFFSYLVKSYYRIPVKQIYPNHMVFFVVVNIRNNGHGRFTSPENYIIIMVTDIRLSLKWIHIYETYLFTYIFFIFQINFSKSFSCKTVMLLSW